MPGPYDVDLTDDELQQPDFEAYNSVLQRAGQSPIDNGQGVPTSASSQALPQPPGDFADGQGLMPDFYGSGLMPTSTPAQRAQALNFEDQRDDMARAQLAKVQGKAIDVGASQAAIDEFDRTAIDTDAANYDARVKYQDAIDRRNGFIAASDANYRAVQNDLENYANYQPSFMNKLMSGYGAMLAINGATKHHRALGAAIAQGAKADIENGLLAEKRRVEASQQQLANTRTMIGDANAQVDRTAAEAAFLLNKVAAPHLAAMERLKLQTTNAKERAALDEAIAITRMNVRNEYANVYDNARKQEVVRHQQARMAKLGTLSDDQLAAYARAGDPIAMKLYKQRLGWNEQQADIAVKNAKAAKDAQEGGAQQILPGVFTTLPLEKAQVDKIQTKQRALVGIQSDLQKLAQLYQRNNWKPVKDKTDTSQADLILNGMTDKLSQFFGGGTAGESAAKRTIDSLMHPTEYHMRGDPLSSYQQTSQHLQESFEQELQSVGAYRQGAGPQTQAPGFTPVGGEPTTVVPNVTGDDGLIDMFNVDTGAVIHVHPSRVQQAESQGFVKGRPSTNQVDYAPSRSQMVHDEDPEDVEQFYPEGGVGASY